MLRVRVLSSSLLCQRAARARAGSRFSTAATAVETDEAAGLTDRERRRRERAMRPKPVAIEGTAPYYTRQLVVVDPESSAPMQWPKKLEFSDHVISKYAHAVGAIEDPKHSTLKAIAATPFPAPPCPAGSTAADNDAITSRKHDLLVFPEKIRVHDVDLSQVPTIVSELLQSASPVGDILAEHNLSFKPLAKGFHVLVCAHEQRDFRCGCNGPKLLQWLQDVGHDKGVPLHLYSSSHFGGHRYAANCIVYPGGDWFGLLNTPQDANALVQALVDGEPLRLREQWRGRISQTKEEQIETLRRAIAAGE